MYFKNKNAFVVKNVVAFGLKCEECEGVFTATEKAKVIIHPETGVILKMYHIECE